MGACAGWVDPEAIIIPNTEDFSPGGGGGAQERKTMVETFLYEREIEVVKVLFI